MLTVKQAAKQHNISTALVYLWIKNRELEHYRLGGRGRRGRILIEPSALDRLIESRKVPSGRAPAPTRLHHIRIKAPA